MYCTTKCFLILCAIPLIKAISLKIDGLLNLGDTWTYEYRVLRTDSSDQLRQRNDETADNSIEENAQQSVKETAHDQPKQIARQREEEIAHYKDKIARQKDEDTARVERDSDHLQLAEQVLRQEAERLRKEAENPKMDQRQGRDQYSQIHYIPNTNVPKTVTTTTTTEAVTDSVDSDESDDSENPKRGTLMIIDEEDTTKNPKKILRDASEYSDTEQNLDSRDIDSPSSLEISASFKDKTRQGVDRQDDDTSSSDQDSAVNIIRMENSSTPSSKTFIQKTLQNLFNKSMHVENKTDDPKFTKVTTVRTADIFTDIHQVKDDLKLLEFTNHLYKQTMNIFSTIKEKTNQDHLKDKIDDLAKSYRDKFKDFLNDTFGQKIKTRLGTQKVILNTIDTSNRLLRRVMNFMVSDLDKKGILRHNAGTTSRFQKAIEVEHKLQLFHACRKFGICRSGSGFSSFLAHIMGILLKCDDKRFKQTIDAFTEVMKNIQYHHLLEPHTENKLKTLIVKIEKENVEMLRAMVTILKNTVTSQNKPMIVSNYDVRRSIVNSTLALLEVVDLLDTQIPNNKTNALKWTEIKKSLEDFADGTRNDVQNIMKAIVKHVTKNLKSLDEKSRSIVSKNLDVILSLAVH